MDSGFWILGGSGGCTTRQFSDGGPSLGGGAEPTVSDTVGEMEGTWWWKQQEKQVKPIFFHVFRDFTYRFGLFMSGGRSLAASLRVPKPTVSDTVGGRKKTGQQKREKEGGKTVGNPSPNCIRYGWLWLPLDASNVFYLDCLPPPRETCLF